MESYQIIADIITKNKTNEEPYSFLFNLFECYSVEFLKKLTIKMETSIEKELKYFLEKNKIDYTKLSIVVSDFKLKLFINKFYNSDIKYIKSNNFYDINVEYIRFDEKLVGVKINSCFYIDRQLLLNNKTENVSIDKQLVGEMSKNCINYTISKVLKNNNLIYFNNIIMNYENYFNKNTREINLDILPYVSLYNSLILRYAIHGKDAKVMETKAVTFLPVSRYNCKNLFMKYQNIFKIFNNDENNLNKKKITFKNPKNEKYFNDGDIIDLKDCNLYLSLRLYCSKMSNVDSEYYRKTTENLDLKIEIIVKRGKIIGMRFGDIEYYIWKNEGNLSEYETYNSKHNYQEMAINIFKDACVFYFKLN